MATNHAWVDAAEAQGVLGHKLFVNDQCRYDTAILLHKRWNDRVKEVVTAKEGIAIRLKQDKGHLLVGSWHLPDAWGHTQEEYEEATDNMAIILDRFKNDKIIFGMDANAEVTRPQEPEGASLSGPVGRLAPRTVPGLQGPRGQTLVHLAATHNLELSNTKEAQDGPEG